MRCAIPRFRWPTIVSAGALLCLGAPAAAYYTGPGSGRGTVAVATLTAPSGLTLVQSAGNVTVSWGVARTTAGTAATGYWVTRADGTAVCGSPSLVQPATSCTDPGPPTGTKYIVNAVLRSWTASATSAALVLLGAPSFSGTPSSVSANPDPTIGLAGGSSYSCRLDNGGYQACAASVAVGGLAGGTLAGGSHTLYAHIVSGSSYGPDAAFTWTVDHSSPTLSTSLPHATNSAAGTFSFSHFESSYTFKCALDAGTFSACTSPATRSGLAEGSHTFAVEGVSADGALTAASSFTWIVDGTAPTQSVSLAAGTAGAYQSGATVFFRGGAAGSLRLVDTVADAGSGAASASFPAAGLGGFSHPAETVSTPAGGPFTSSAFSWGAGASGPPPYRVSGADAAGNTTSSSITFKSDSTPPTGGALTVNGTAASTGGSQSHATAASWPINLRTDFAEAASGTSSGLASSGLSVLSAGLSGGACGAAGSAGPFRSAQTIAGTTEPSGILTGYCYFYTLAGTDNVGNTASLLTSVAFDATPPSAPTLSFGALNNAYYDSATNTVWFRGGTAGGFTVTASAADPESGIAAGNAGYTFSAIGGGITGGQSGGSENVAISASATAPATSPSVVATNGYGLTGSATGYSLKSDTTAPSGGSVSYVNGTTSAPVSVTFSPGTDTGSGVRTASGFLKQAVARLNGGGNCIGWSAFSVIATAPTSPYSDASATSGHCYEYEYLVSDNAGNQATYTSPDIAQVP